MYMYVYLAVHSVLLYSRAQIVLYLHKCKFILTSEVNRSVQMNAEKSTSEFLCCVMVVIYMIRKKNDESNPVP